jgi:hypothetical protein
VLDRRHRHEPQLASRQPPRQSYRIPLIDLDPVGRSAIGATRRTHQHLDPMGPSTTRKPIAGRASLIHHPCRHRDLHQPPNQLMRPPHHPTSEQLARSLIKHRDRRLVKVHIKTDQRIPSATSVPPMQVVDLAPEAITLEREHTPATAGVPTQLHSRVGHQPIRSKSNSEANVY